MHRSEETFLAQGSSNDVHGVKTLSKQNGIRN